MKTFAEHIAAGDFDARGIHLIEASAGTGKTYSIQTLYLRLVVSEGIPVRQLLVVTFTEAATGELRERLRAILDECRRRLEVCEKTPEADRSDAGRIARILALPLKNGGDGAAASPDAARLRRLRVERALLDFDQAAIFTIHGFCRRVLRDFAFECGHDFDAEVINGNALLHEICADRWRRIKYAGDDSLAAAIAAEKCPDVGSLAGLTDAFVKRPDALLLPEHAPETLVRLERRVLESVRAAGAHAVRHARAIAAGVSGADAAPFFGGQPGRKIAAGLAEAAEVESPARLYKALQRLAEALRTARVPNPLAIPAPVEACIAAAQAAAGGEDATARALGLVREHAKALEEFLDEVARHAAWFNKTDLTDPVKRVRHLEALKRAERPRDVAAALGKLASLKRKPTVAWRPGVETVRLLELIARTDSDAALYGRAVLAAGLAENAARYERRKRESRVMTFDDMLTRLDRALNGTADAVALRAALRARYRAALIDEFQDTDPLQYRIFESVFAGTDAPLFFVGDPKQAIYSFRGGDVYTYCAAKAAIPAARHYALDTNYRSQAPLIDAVNTVFRDRDGVSLFGRADIAYAADLKSNDTPLRFVEAGMIDRRPFKIWDYRRESGARGADPSGYRSEAARFVYALVAAEIVKLLGDSRAGFVPADASAAGGNRGDASAAPGFRRLRPSDIAILVRRHAEAACLYGELIRRGVRTVRQAGSNVFDAPEAEGLLHLLKALALPGNLQAVKTALASRLLPVSDAEIMALAEGRTVACAAAEALGAGACPDSLESWLELFREVSETWRRRGFAAAFDTLAERTGMQAWLASRSGGERALVNLIQLQDLLQRAAADRRLGFDALLGWYKRQLDGNLREEDDAFETRLESDADAVRIMTVFKSKGLEFPVVFVPTMWTEIAGRRREIHRIYHAGDGRANLPAHPGGARIPETVMHLDLDDAEAAQADTGERMQEDIRNFYVAATRGAYRVYVVAGDLGGRDATLRGCLPRDLFETWGRREDTGIEVVPISPRPVPLIRLPAPPSGSGNGLDVAGAAAVDTSRGHASFSALAPHAPAAPAAAGDGRDYDAGATITEAAASPSGAGIDRYNFPAGARTGECLHRLFERLDFAASPESIRAAVAEQLALFRLDTGGDDEVRARRDAIGGMVADVFNAPIAVGDAKTLRLADVPAADRRAEMAFDFALKAGPDNAVRQILMDAWKDAPAPESLFRERLANWQRAIPGGFMTGFIDLFFRHDRRYYLLDWKTNRLDGNPASFDPGPRLYAEMAAHAYFLQYLIYTVAVDAYLRQSLGGGYDYDRDFGGVLYLFVRGVGVDSPSAGRRGVFFIKPDGDLVRQLARALIPGNEDNT